MPKVILVSGYGSGISEAVARKFGKEGFAVALVGRTADRLEKGAKALGDAGITAKGFPCDVGDADAVRALVGKVHDTLGPVAVLHWNAYAAGLAGDLVAAPGAELRKVLDVGVHGLLAAVQAALADLKAAKGAVLVTGGGLSAYDEKTDEVAVAWGAMGLAVAKAAQHKLTGLLNKKLAPDGVYAGEVTVLGLVKGTAFDGGNATIEPAAVAEKFWGLFQARKDVYDSIG